MHEDFSTKRPTSLSHIVGQRNVVEQVRVAVEAAFADQRPMASCLLVGAPGLGKSDLAHVVGCEMATDFHEVLGQSLTTTADLNYLLLRATDKCVVHIDEAHQLTRKIQTALYLALDQKKISLKGAGPVTTLPIANFTLLLSTTDEFDLLQPLRDRMSLVLRFEFYSFDELATILRSRAANLRWEIEDQLLRLISKRARGTPRLALRLLAACHRVCRAGDETIVTFAHFQRACQMENIDELGLGPSEQHYLSLLVDGAKPMKVLASMIGHPDRTISDVIEPFLLRAGLIVKNAQSRRELTALGRIHASDCCPIHV